MFKYLDTSFISKTFTKNSDFVSKTIISTTLEGEVYCQLCIIFLITFYFFSA